MFVPRRRRLAQPLLGRASQSFLRPTFADVAGKCRPGTSGYVAGHELERLSLVRSFLKLVHAFKPRLIVVALGCKAPGVGLEPTTYGLTVRRSAD
jgi:hypothetical protein